jgi:protein ImuB
VARLIKLKLDAAAATDDAGFGFEAVGLAITRAEPMPARQAELPPAAGDADRTEQCAALVDALRQRLGPQRVRRFAALASHLPERAEVLLPVESFQSMTLSDPLLLEEEEKQPRPLLLLPHAEPAEDVAALVPDGPPRRFSWRGVTHEVKGAQGPERIASEWWREPHLPARPRESEDPVLDSRLRGKERRQALTRDYYLVEDSAGHRFWLFREGLYERETTTARWFVHGLFA